MQEMDAGGGCRRWMQEVDAGGGCRRDDDDELSTWNPFVLLDFSLPSRPCPFVDKITIDNVFNHAVSNVITHEYR
jgi:hypothetical protein